MFVVSFVGNRGTFIRGYKAMVMDMEFLYHVGYILTSVLGLFAHELFYSILVRPLGLSWLAGKWASWGFYSVTPSYCWSGSIFGGPPPDCSQLHGSFLGPLEPVSPVQRHCRPLAPAHLGLHLSPVSPQLCHSGPFPELPGAPMPVHQTGVADSCPIGGW